MVGRLAAGWPAAAGGWLAYMPAIQFLDFQKDVIWRDVFTEIAGFQLRSGYLPYVEQFLKMNFIF